MRLVLTRFSIKFRLKDSKKSISNKIVRLENILREVSY